MKLNPLFSESMKVIIIASSIPLFSLNTFIFDVSAQHGGAATGGDATVGGPNCNVAYACPITQDPTEEQQPVGTLQDLHHHHHLHHSQCWLTEHNRLTEHLQRRQSQLEN